LQCDLHVITTTTYVIDEAREIRDGYMNSSASASTIAERLLAGPRGRRFLLEYALASELAQNPVRSEESFGSAAFDAAYRLDPAVISGSARKYQSLFGEVTEQPDMPVVTPAEAAERLDM